MTCSARVRSAAATPGRAYSAVMPLPTSAGVLGMARTMRCVPSHWAMLSERMPAATLRCSALAVWARTAAAACLKVCGFTAQTTRPARSSAGPALFPGRDAELLLELVARVGEGLHHFDLRGGQALAHQAADDGAGHVAAADEGDGRLR